MSSVSGLNSGRLMLLLLLVPYLPCSLGVLWSMEDCPLTACDCNLRLLTINCRNKALNKLDIGQLKPGYFRSVTTLDLRYNELQILPDAAAFHLIFPDVRLVHLAQNPPLNCRAIAAFREGLAQYQVSVTDSVVCIFLTSQAPSTGKKTVDDSSQGMQLIVDN